MEDLGAPSGADGVLRDVIKTIADARSEGDTIRTIYMGVRAYGDLERELESTASVSGFETGYAGQLVPRASAPYCIIQGVRVEQLASLDDDETLIRWGSP